MTAEKPKRGSLETISVEGKLTESGVKASVRSRAATAFDRLLGTVVDWGTVIAERQVRRAELRGEYEEKLLRLRADDALEHEKQLLLENALKRERRSRDNLIGVTQKTVEHLTDTSKEENERDISDPLSEDWLNIFESYAEKASSERMQDTWARVLTGEIRKPGAFCLPTLRFVAELDQTVASAFEEVLIDRFQDQLPRPNKIAGVELQKYLLLEEVGLITNLSGLGGITYTPPGASEDGFRYIAGSPGAFQPGKLLLRLKAGSLPDIGILPLTRVGKEIASILPRSPDLRSLEYLAEQYKDSADELEIINITSTDGLRIDWEIFKKYK